MSRYRIGAPGTVALTLLLGACAASGRATEPTRAALPAPNPQVTASFDQDASNCRERPGGPSRTQCVAIVEHLNRVMPEQMRSDRAADVCDCLEMPAGFIACLETVRSSAEANACVKPPAGSPTLAECKKTVSHLKVLDPRFAADTSEDEVVTACMDEATRPELDCINAATTRAEIDRCDAVQ